MDPITLGLLAGAGTGLAKSYLIDKPQEERDRQLQATTARWSPWTGIKPQSVKNANPLGNAIEFGGTGASMGLGIQNANAQNALNSSIANRLNTGGSLSSDKGANLVATPNFDPTRPYVNSDPYWGGTNPYASGGSGFSYNRPGNTWSLMGNR